MATKITTDKIGKDGGVELELPSSSQTLPTEGTSNLTVNPQGQIEIGASSASTTPSTDPESLMFYMDKDGKFYDEKDKMDCPEFTLSSSDYESGSHHTWTKISFGHAENSQTSGDTIVINGDTYSTPRKPSFGSYGFQANTILHIGFEFDKQAVFHNAHRLNIVPFTGAMKSGIENRTDTSTHESRPNQIFDDNEYDVTTNSTNYWSSNGQQQGQYKMIRYAYLSMGNVGQGSHSGSSYNAHIQSPHGNWSTYGGFPEHQNEYGFMRGPSYVKYGFSAQEHQTTFTGPQGDVNTKGAKNAHHGNWFYEAEGRLGNTNNSQNFSRVQEFGTASTSYGMPIFTNSINGLAFCPNISSGSYGSVEVFAQFRAYVCVRRN